VYFVQSLVFMFYRDKKVVGVFVRFRQPTTSFTGNEIALSTGYAYNIPILLFMG
jgi:hypothetical protein